MENPENTKQNTEQWPHGSSPANAPRITMGNAKTKPVDKSKELLRAPVAKPQNREDEVEKNLKHRDLSKS